uniref:Pre-mRNA-splicing factor SPF27 n=1 Tax=Loxodonta africana TaxID=9785 RepID=G3UAZ1_LOXAF
TVGTGFVALEAMVDALAYFDQGYEAPDVQKAAVALVQKKAHRYQPTKNYLSYLTALDYSAFGSDIMRNEFQRLAARQPIEFFSMKNYITAWEECVDNSMSQLGHQAVRIENLELMSQHGCNAWKVYNENLVHMIENIQKELQKLMKHNQNLNWQKMESTGISLVSKKYEIKQTIVQLENEIYQIQQQGEANKENIQQDF